MDGWRAMPGLLPAAAAGLAALAAGLAGAGPALTATLAAGGAGAAAIAARALGRGRARGKTAPAGLAPRQGGPGGALRAGTGRFLLDHMPEGVLLIDRSGRTVFMNPQARRLFGALPDAPFPVAALRVPSLLAAIERALAGHPRDKIGFQLTRTRDMHLAAHVISLAGEQAAAGERELGALVVIDDETQTRLAEQLHRDFVANASHELKTPLAAVSAIIETLNGHARGDAAAEARFLGMMAAQVERMKTLIEDLISLNRIEINERVRPQEPQPIARIAHEAAESLRPLAEASAMRIVAPAPADRPRVPGSREELSQVFVNLIENALRYGKPSPEVRVRLIENDLERPGMVGIAIEDDGPGIAREHIPRLTERFYRVSVSRSRERGGTGLGLAIVKHILNRHRGQLVIESMLGKGSRFTAWLPLAEPAAEAGRDGPVPAEAAQQSAPGTARGQPHRMESDSSLSQNRHQSVINGE